MRHFGGIPKTPQRGPSAGNGLPLRDSVVPLGESALLGGRPYSRGITKLHPWSRFEGGSWVTTTIFEGDSYGYVSKAQSLTCRGSSFLGSS